MPYYEYQCPVCKAIYVEKRPIADRDSNPPQCCYQKTERVMLTPPAGSVDTPAAG